MFEKEAEEYAVVDLPDGYTKIDYQKKTDYQKGAEFGYNKAKKEHEGKCRTAYIKGIRTMANALKNYDRTDGVWTDYFEHTVEEVLNKLLKENE